MSGIKRQSVKATVYTYLGVAIGFVTTAILYPSYLSTAQIGVLSLLVSYSLLLSQFGSLGIGGVITRYLPGFRDKMSGHHGFLTFILLVCMAGFVLSTIGFFLVKPSLVESNLEESPLFVEYMDLIIPLTFFGILFTVLDLYNSALYVATTGTFLRDVVQRLLFIFFLGLLVIDIIDFNEYVYLYVLSICLITIFLIIFLAYRKEFVISFNLSRFTKPTLITLGSYSLFSWMNSFSSLAVTRIDVIMLNEYYNSSITGIYSITFYFATLIILPSRVFGKTSAIYLSEAFHRNDYKTVEEIHKKVSLNQWIIGLYVMLGLVCNLDNVFRILPQEYEAGAWVIVLIGISNLVRMIGGLDNAIIDFSKEYRILSLFMVIFLVIQIVLNFVLIPPFEMIGAALSALIAVAIFTLLKASYIYKKMDIVSFSWGHFLALIVAGITYVILYFIPQFENLIFDISFRSIIVTLLFGLPIVLLKISNDVNQLLAKALDLLRKR